MHIEIDEISKIFGTTAALHPVSLAIPSGALVALLGPSGSGKTTLLRMINALLAPDRGTITIEGAPIGSIDPISLRRRTGIVFQSAALFPHLSVASNIGVTPKLLAWPQRDISDRVDELLDLVRLDRARYRDRFPHELSGGEKQRVGIARALAARPRLVLMDEPFGALDPLTRDALGDDYRALHDRFGLTSVMITHDMTEAMLLADRIAVMHGGRLLAAGSAQTLSASGDPHVGELLRTPRRQAKRLGALLPGGS